MNIIDEDRSAVYFCAFRYALGRCTYMPTIISRQIANDINFITTNDLVIMRREILDAKGRNALGMEGIDDIVWLNLDKVIDEELHRRKYVEVM